METHVVAACCWCASKLVKLDGHWWCPQKPCRTKQLEWSIAMQVPKQGTHGGGFQGFEWKRWFVPLPKQVAFLELPGKRKLMAGAVGPGKSKTARNGAYRLCLTVPNLSVLLTRKTHPELERTHIKEMRREQDDIGFKWMEQAGQCRFKNGSVIECGHLEDEAAVQKYLSAEYDLIILEEAVQYKPDAIMELMSRARTSNERVKELGGPWVWALTNPGGPSHHLLESLFIEKEPDTETYPAMAKFYNPTEWSHVHTTLDDNPYIAEDYAAIALSGLRKTRYAQLRHGDWSAADGAFFECFGKKTHSQHVELNAPIDGVIEGMDWGYSSPGCWVAVAHIGDGHWHVIGEWKFKGLTPEQVADGIKDRRRELGIGHVSYTVGDPAMFSKHRGESIAETMGRCGVSIRPGINERELGWMRLMAAFQTAPDGRPWLTYEPSCTYSLRSIPALLADKNNPEDVDTKLDDHAADAIRYWAMSRPSFSAPKPKPAEEIPNSWAFWRRWHESQSQGSGVLA